ncbi:CPBP family intramembrane glutamic endopeptidase [Rathayibacter toxicus]|uniref:CPBP family intramembrane metalloprotease n=1 Tax=Rathayibacter toxicus TaxID=145458 RepID=A0A2S5Y664_9MICO|nr:CPBP family intramembrane glutamic endopeptidase [Rathayibacter toxicus]PPH22658.1 CPBP family intramembrane metalloprotease [Rathayibacter toxicus]PPH56860.1 CPBP family intramembrane metalloprotease [Rathayibacter toxicus]PPH59552.1 CPBP family intramembrane metalloprotease [Rathayibacter toxicus]PPH86782.1 CPBP family intramembrane metalloprotease [Rathayibacter toxicus]PPI14500.1 CPBP family intramembrane metalloprotease [Rathayibacter toxicus]
MFTVPATDSHDRRRIRSEILLVLGLSLGASAIYSLVSLANRLTRSTALTNQSVTINGPLSDRPTFDLISQLLGLVFSLVPVALCAFLLWQSTEAPLARLGLDLRRPLRDLGTGTMVALVIGAPGLALYVVGRELGITVAITASPLDHQYWWTVPVLILSAIRAGIQEEVIVVGYLFARLGDLGWGRWRILFSSALLRGSYHLYQGIGPFLGNVIMGIVFGLFFYRYGRTLPLVIAHSLIDAVSFVGYPLAVALWPEFFASTATRTPA